MITTRHIVLEGVFAAPGDICEENAGRVSPEAVAATGFKYRRVSSMPVFELAMKAVSAAKEDAHGKDLEIGAVVAATFSAEDRFPALSVKIASAAGLKTDVPAFDIQMACSAYPYAVYAAGKLAADLGKAVLLVDGDVQSRLVGGGDAAAAMVMGDALTATLVRASDGDCSKSGFSFLSSCDTALFCGESGPISMDGFKVFSFVAAKVKPMLAQFIAESGPFDRFVPHQANMYMLRQLAKGLGVESKMLLSGEEYGNVGSASIPLTLAAAAAKEDLRSKRVLLAGFGAGFSAAAAAVSLSDTFSAKVLV